MDKQLVSLTNNRWLKTGAALILAVVLVLSAARLDPVRQAEQSASVDAFTAHIEQRIPELMKTYRIPGVSMALVQNKSIVWTHAFGYADIASGVPMTPDAVCRVQSISKSVTAWAVMKLVEQGEIDLDQPVANYLQGWKLPESGFSQDKVTVRQLLSHTAGMPLGDILTRFAPQDDMPSLTDKLSMEAQLIREPGAAFSYSNTGYNLLELVIESVTGQEFAMYMEQEILMPLGMTGADFVWRESFDPPVPYGYNLKGEAIPVYVYPEKASGGLFATAEDIARFILAGMPGSSQTVLPAERVSQLYEPAARDMGLYSLVFDAYGLGHYIEFLAGGQLAVSHGGQGTGWMTHFHAVPEAGAALVILTNSQRSWPFIASVLSDWASWNGFASIGMERILLGQRILWSVIGLIWFGLFWQLFRLLAGLIGKKRRFAPSAKPVRVIQVLQFAVFVCLSAVLVWCISQPYLNITSIFPRASEWLGISVLALALVSLLSALFPVTARQKTGKPIWAAPQ